MSETVSQSTTGALIVALGISWYNITSGAIIVAHIIVCPGVKVKRRRAAASWLCLSGHLEEGGAGQLGEGPDMNDQVE
jgi:hypothetical protein